MKRDCRSGCEFGDAIDEPGGTDRRKNQGRRSRPSTSVMTLELVRLENGVFYGSGGHDCHPAFVRVALRNRWATPSGLAIREKLDERRVGKGCVSTCRSWWSLVQYIKKHQIRNRQ